MPFILSMLFTLSMVLMDLVPFIVDEVVDDVFIVL